MALVPFAVKLYAERPSLKERFLRVDWFGMALFLASTCSLLIGITAGGTQFPWNSWRTLIPVIFGLVGLVLALLWERFSAPKPFLRLSLFQTRSANAAYCCTVLQGLVVSISGALPYL
jgi:hypothetical protein